MKYSKELGNNYCHKCSGIIEDEKKLRINRTDFLSSGYQTIKFYHKECSLL